MTAFDLLLKRDPEMSLDAFAKEFFSIVDVSSYAERESSHCAEDRYFLGERDGVSFKVMRSEDEDHSDLPFWVSIKVDADAGRAFHVDEFVRDTLMPRGFKVARLTNFGWADETRRDY